MLDVMSELAATAKPLGIVVTTTRRVAIAVTIALVVALLLLILWKGSTSALFLRAIVLALSATTVFSLFEVWPQRLPRGVERWSLQVVAVGAAMPVTVFVMHRRATFPGAPPFFDNAVALTVAVVSPPAARLLEPGSSIRPAAT